MPLDIFGLRLFTPSQYEHNFSTAIGAEAGLHASVS
jgi:hypothetical protein